MIALEKYIKSFYSESEYPALAQQISRWKELRPFAGMKILDGTPVFRNTMVKYCALLAGGAELTVSAGKDIPADLQILKMLPDFNIRVATEKILREKFDIVADCAGRHRGISSCYGYAELTRSGLEYYRECQQPVFSVDSGILKLFETALGTGNGFVRAMEHLGYGDFSGKKILIFGGGKVGRGIAYCSVKNGASVTIADKKSIPPLGKVDFVDANDKNALIAEIRNSWCIVSATGLSNALTDLAQYISNSNALVANMGVEDEFSPAVASERVLNGKKPLNFILEEPTLLKYIDPSMALSNAALEFLKNGTDKKGIFLPPEEMEKTIFEQIRQAGLPADAAEFILKEYSL